MANEVVPRRVFWNGPDGNRFFRYRDGGPGNAETIRVETMGMADRVFIQGFVRVPRRRCHLTDERVARRLCGSVVRTARTLARKGS
jgi:hypothetical protein